MKILVYEPNKAGYVKSISGNIKSMQEVIGGYMEAIFINQHNNLYDLARDGRSDLIVLCNEEGLLMGLEPNRGLVGTFFICKKEGPEMSGLTDEDIEYIKANGKFY